MNARDLAALPDVGRVETAGPQVVGPERIGRFLELARRHTERLVNADWTAVLDWWDGPGVLTVGQHTGLAAGEWHVHAWDLARSAAAVHRPTDSGAVAAARRAVRATGRRRPLAGRPPLRGPHAARPVDHEGSGAARRCPPRADHLRGRQDA